MRIASLPRLAAAGGGSYTDRRMASSRKRAETKEGASARRAGKRPSRTASGAAGRRTAAAPSSSAAKKNDKADARGVTRPAKPKAAVVRQRKKRVATTVPARPAAAKTAARATKKRAAAKTTKAARPAAPKGTATARPATATAAKARAGTTGAKKAAARTGTGAVPKPAARRRRGQTGTPGAEAVGAPHAVEGLNEEDQIRSAKYLPRELPRRLFEEERFVFPETYGVNRIRLLVRDPEWIFAYWDVSPAAMKDFAKSIGERALALSRLTLRVIDPVSGGSTDILLPPAARWWYVRTDQSRRTYRAELGVTLPSGEFRRLADSNTVVTPRVGPSPERARRRMSYPEARELPLAAAAAASEAEKRNGVAVEPWAPGAIDGAAAPNGAEGGTRVGAKGGASDTLRPGGASDSLPGASDAFRR